MARRSHPGCKIGLVLDQDTELSNNGTVDVLHRLTIDKSKFGRNEYNDLYHWQVRDCCCLGSMRADWTKELPDAASLLYLHACYSPLLVFGMDSISAA